MKEQNKKDDLVNKILIIDVGDDIQVSLEGKRSDFVQLLLAAGKYPAFQEAICMAAHFINIQKFDK
jgi:hypothetical protein